MTPGWTVVFAGSLIDDLALVEAHLTRSYRDLGESQADAMHHAEMRIEAILSTAERLAAASFRGAARDDLMPGLRNLALDSTVYWFVPDVESQQVKVLAIFLGGQGHQRHMLVRLLQRSRP